VNEKGELSSAEPEPTENVVTWVYEEGSFVPSAKLVGKEKYSIISNYLGTPESAYDSQGNKVWEREIDIYGKVKKGDSIFVPFLYQGQYFDSETELAYNRFRYYSPETGTYISQDPIGLAGGNSNIYSYVANVNLFIDIFGLYEIVLGMSPYNSALEYDLNAAGTKAYADANWKDQKISSKKIDSKTFVSQFDKASKNADVIHFSLSGLNPEQVKKAGLEFKVVNGELVTGNVTSVELNKVLNNEDLFNKTKFYQMKADGSFEEIGNKDSVKKHFH